MAAKNESFGMMDGAYFVGRREILEWINGTLQLNLSTIEQTASGCVALQLLDSLHPGSVPMSKVDWTAKQDFQFVGNYKILQNSFDKLGVGKHVDVDKLIRAKYQDNLEFMQWFKRYHQSVGMATDYDPVAARAGGKGAPGATGCAAPASARGPAPRRGMAPAGATRTAAGRGTTIKRAPAGSAAVAGAAGAAAATAPAASRSAPAGMETSAQVAADLAAKEERIAALTHEVSEMLAAHQTVERERDFYFEKLRDVEVLLQLREEHGHPVEGAADVFKILYASQEDIVAVSDTGEILEGEAARAYKEAAEGVEQPVPVA